MKALEVAKKSCIDHVRDTVGVLVDSPTGSGGNTNTGPLSDAFFHPRNRELVSQVILNEQDRENFKIMLNLSFI